MTTPEPEIDFFLWGKRVAWILIPAIIVLTPLYWFFSYGSVHGPGPEEGDSVHVTIHAGGGFSAIYTSLVESEVLYDDARFSMLASWSGISKRLKAGEYTFIRPVTPKDVLGQLEKGSSALYPVTLREGLSVYEIAAELQRQGWEGKDDIVALCMDPDFVGSLGVAAPTLEGYLFPDTYFLGRSQSGRSVLKMMVDRFFQVWAELENQYRENDTLDWMLNFSRHELVILASIVEKETGLAEERPQIATVFYNRLEKKMRLQADPTVIYGLGTYFDGNLTKRDLRTPSAYNTYLLSGLPAGPIANPGKEALRAVLSPLAGQWLYFVARGDGSHQFSSNLNDHNKAVYEFQKKGQQ